MPTRASALSKGLLVSLSMMCMLGWAAGAAADPRVFLSWGAPWGTPRARANLLPDCSDTTRVDTLFLCFDPGRDTTLVGMTAALWFRPGDRDTLDHAWHFEDRTLPRLRAFFGDQPSCGVPTPWGAGGSGGARYHSLTDAGSLRMIWAVPASQPVRVDSGTVYLFARVMVPRPRDPRACARPLCIEWGSAAVAFGPRSNVPARAVMGAVGWNSPGGAACSGVRKNPMIQPWTPPKQRH